MNDTQDKPERPKGVDSLPLLVGCDWEVDSTEDDGIYQTKLRIRQQTFDIGPKLDSPQEAAWWRAVVRSGVQKLCPDSEIWVYRKHCEDQYGDGITEYQKGVLMGLDIALGFFRSSWEANRFSPNSVNQRQK